MQHCLRATTGDARSWPYHGYLVTKIPTTPMRGIGHLVLLNCQAGNQLQGEDMD